MNTMNFKRTMNALFLAALLFAPMIGSAQVTTTTTTATSVETEEYTYMTATVTAVDQMARTVTLKGKEGNVMTITVSDDVKRLAEVKVGDQLEFGYLEAVGLDFRTPTEEELKEPYKVMEQTDRLDNTHAPTGVKQRMIRAVVTLEGMSRWLNVLTVKGPKGNYFVVEVAPSMVKWEELRIGQQMVGTYTEALIMSIEPAVKK